jgi:hypothetical protein
MKKRRPRKPIPKRGPVQRPESRLSRALKVVGSIGTVLGLIYAILLFWPQISVEPTATADSSNPLSGYFKITNEQSYPLTVVSIEASLRCAKIGTGNDTGPLDKCLPSMRSANQRWSKHTLDAHEPYEITPGDRIFITPGGLLYAQMAIFVSYRPWLLPIHREKEFRFETRRLSDGRIEWLHIRRIDRRAHWSRRQCVGSRYWRGNSRQWLKSKTRPLRGDDHSWIAFARRISPGQRCERAESYRRDGVAAGDPFVRLFSQAPAVAPARKVTTKLSIVNVSIMDKKRSGEKKVPAP